MISDAEVLIASSIRAYVGGGYFNPVDDLIAAGRLIAQPTGLDADVNLEIEQKSTYYFAQLYSYLTGELESGELLFALYTRRHMRLAPYIFDVERLSDFEWQASRGLLRTDGYYAVPYDLGDAALRRIEELEL